MDDARKPVTILFTDIVGSTAHAEKLDPEEWKEVVNGAHRRVTGAVTRHEGTVAQLRIPTAIVDGGDGSTQRIS